jgi:hypothetical protein
MQRYICFGAAIGFAMGMALYAADFKVYPGAKLDEKLSKEAKARIYVTSESYEKVSEFYKAIGKEYNMPGISGKTKKLPSGNELKQAFFIFDGAGDLGSSKLWAKIQRPYIGLKLEEGPNKTYIIVVEKK